MYIDGVYIQDLEYEICVTNKNDNLFLRDAELSIVIKQENKIVLEEQKKLRNIYIPPLSKIQETLRLTFNDALENYFNSCNVKEGIKEAKEEEREQNLVVTFIFTKFTYDDNTSIDPKYKYVDNINELGIYKVKLEHDSK